MENMYGTTSSTPPETDDISLFLHEILLRSSSSSSSAPMAKTAKEMQSFAPTFTQPENQYFPDRIFTAESLNSSSSGAYFPPNTTNMSSSSVGTKDNDPDDHDWESEEGFASMAKERNHHRNLSKRSRAAEVHNLSEKRRRSRINEKLKALQNLIPNSNKTNKASMLDDAIDYLKQLQLQVQMLTMRNGLNLHPIVPPETMQPIQMLHTKTGFDNGNRSLHMMMNTGEKLCMNPETSTNGLFDLSGQICNSGQKFGADLSNLETPFGLESYDPRS